MEFQRLQSMKNKIGLFTGTFDPVTKGHLDIIQRASLLFDKLYIGIFKNETKSPLFRLEERVLLIEEAVADLHLDNVEVIAHNNDLTVKVAEKLEVTALVRSVRNATDLEYEKNMIYFNREMTGIETILLAARPELENISSSRMRELYHFGQELSQWLPQNVIEALNKKKSNED